MLPFAARVERDVVHAHGDDTVGFLHGQLSQDVAALPVGASAWALLLEPAGKVVAWLRATRVGEQEVVLDTDPGAGAAVVARLERFKLRTRCDLDLAERQPALAVRGVERAADGPGMPIAWPGVAGYDLLGPGGTPPEGVPLAGHDAYELARIGAGVPVSGVDIGADTIPAEAGGWLVDASVSFTKGCYTGQELVARVDSRGSNVPHPLRRLRIEGRAVAGAEVTAGGAPVGRVTSVAWDATAGACLALGPVGRAVAVGAAVVVGGVPATVVG